MTRSRSDVIADELEDLILKGAFADGARLDEAGLADRFSVSRTPIREALLRLQRTGLVEHRPRRGVFVRQPGPVELLEMFEVMAELEAVCARLSATRISEDAIARLTEINARCRTAPDADAYFTENEIFHRTLYAEARNRFLEAECLRLHRRLRPFRRLQLRLRGRLQQSLAEHEAILAALEAGAAEDAASAMRTHVAVQGEKFHHLVASLGTNDRQERRSTPIAG
ncbi:MAG: GntR family transcriptional regulator [Pseudomonadota bacterium]